MYTQLHFSIILKSEKMAMVYFTCEGFIITLYLPSLRNITICCNVTRSKYSMATSADDIIINKQNYR